MTKVNIRDKITAGSKTDENDKKGGVRYGRRYSVFVSAACFLHEKVEIFVQVFDVFL